MKEAECLDKEVFVFRNPAGSVIVLHRKRDGIMELIEAAKTNAGAPLSTESGAAGSHRNHQPGYPGLPAFRTMARDLGSVKCLGGLQEQCDPRENALYAKA